tara:strand:+ start:595 stop:903 length:309 start_codon:yes stop_codon:yes gene_type:complete
MTPRPLDKDIKEEIKRIDKELKENLSITCPNCTVEISPMADECESTVTSIEDYKDMKASRDYWHKQYADLHEEVERIDGVIKEYIELKDELITVINRFINLK